jgi:hypothetical protein
MPLAVNERNGAVQFLDGDGKWQAAQVSVNPQTKQMLAFDGKDWLPVPATSKGVLGYIDDAVRSLASGVTFGYADELAAKANSTFNGKTYEENLQNEAARDASIPAAIKIPGEIGGAVAATIAAAPVRAPLAIASGAAKLPGVVRAALGGAGAGALYGSGTAQPGLENRVEGALEGGAVGAGVGAAAPYVVGAGNKIYQTVKGALVPESSASRQLGRAMVRDDMTPVDVATAANNLANDRPGVATVADVGGENVKGLLERVSQTPGAGRTIAIPALTERQNGQLSRISDDLTSLTGTNKTAYTAIKDTMEERSQAAKPLYDAAMNFNARNDPAIYKTWLEATHTGWGEKILNSEALKRNLQTQYGIDDVKQAPLMTLIDSWKKVSDDLIQSTKQSGDRNTARIISELKDKVISEVDAANPAYAAARNAWAGSSSYLDAIDQGKNIFNKKIDSEEWKSTVTALNPSELEAVRIGAISAIRAQMGNDAGKLSDLTKYIRSPEMREKIGAIMPSKEAAEAWNRRLDFEMGSSELTGRALKNSATARRIAEKEDAQSMAGDLILEFATGGSGGGLMRRILTGAPTAIRDTLRSRSDKALAEILTDPDALQNLQGILSRYQKAATPVSPQALQAGTRGTIATIEE